MEHVADLEMLGSWCFLVRLARRGVSEYQFPDVVFEEQNARVRGVRL